MLTPRRVSKKQWIYDPEDKIIESFSKYIGILTNQNVLYSEPWQILNYGIGGKSIMNIKITFFFNLFILKLIQGEYFPHHDFVKNVDVFIFKVFFMHRY